MPFICCIVLWGYIAYLGQDYDTGGIIVGHGVSAAAALYEGSRVNCYCLCEVSSVVGASSLVFIELGGRTLLDEIFESLLILDAVCELVMKSVVGIFVVFFMLVLFWF